MLLLAVLLTALVSGCQSAGNKEALKPTLHAIRSSPSSVLGDSVTFTCTAPGQDSPTHFMLYKDGMNLRFTEVGNGSVMAFEIQLVTVYDSGIYFCQYQISETEMSKYSDYVQLTVTELLWPKAVGFRLMIVFILHTVVLVTWLLYPNGGEDPKKNKTEMRVPEYV